VIAQLNSSLYGRKQILFWTKSTRCVGKRSESLSIDLRSAGGHTLDGRRGNTRIARPQNVPVPLFVQPTANGVSYGRSLCFIVYRYDISGWVFESKVHTEGAGCELRVNFDTTVRKGFVQRWRVIALKPK